MRTLIRPALSLFVLLTVMTGFIYPLVVTGIAQAVFSHEANGSLIGDGTVGSELIGQPFDDPKYFWGRPSATSPVPYNAGASSGSNLGPSNPALAEALRARVEAIRSVHGESLHNIPVDLVTASGSGLDPHVSPVGALYQIDRIANNRHLPRTRVRELVESHIEGRTFGFLGEPRVNILRLNFALDGLEPNE